MYCIHIRSICAGVITLFIIPSHPIITYISHTTVNYITYNYIFNYNYTGTSPVLRNMSYHFGMSHICQMWHVYSICLFTTVQELHGTQPNIIQSNHKSRLRYIKRYLRVLDYQILYKSHKIKANGKKVTPNTLHSH